MMEWKTDLHVGQHRRLWPRLGSKDCLHLPTVSRLLGVSSQEARSVRCDRIDAPGNSESREARNSVRQTSLLSESVLSRVKRLRAYQVVAGAGAPSRCSSKTTQAAAKARHWGSRRVDIQLAQNHTGARVEESKAAADTNSGTGSRAQQKPARVRLQQKPCVMDARRRTIASGSCCCSPRSCSRNYSGCRRESSAAATAHSMAARRA